MRPFSVLISDGEHPLALQVMRSLGRTGRVIVDLLTSERRSPFRLSRYCRRCHVTATSIDKDERREAVIKAVRTAKIDVVLPVSVAGVRLLAAERQILSQHAALPPLPDTATLDTADDKAALCRLAQRHGIPTPPSFVFDGAPDPPLEQLAYPVLVKPPSLYGGIGIRLFHEPHALAAHLATNRARCVLQSYLEGFEFGLNVLCRDGEILAFTVQRNTLSASPPFGPAAGIHLVEDAEVLATGRRLLAALRWNGVANLDMLRCAATGETLVLEMNPRYWGTLMGSVRAGVNFPYLACLAALERPMPCTAYQPSTYAEKSVAPRQMLNKILGRPHLAGIRLRNTALWTSLIDPLPASSHYCTRAWNRSAKAAWSWKHLLSRTT